MKKNEYILLLVTLIFLIASILLDSFVGLVISGIFLVFVFSIIFPEFVLFLFFGMYPILPDYFAIEISPSLPLLTAGRAILMLFIVYLFFFSKKKISMETWNFFRKSKYGVFLGLLFLCETIVSIAAFPSSDAMNNLFYIMIQQFLVFFVVLKAVDSKKCFEKCIDAILLVALIIGCFALVETLTKFNIFSLLHMNFQREFYGQAEYMRLNVRRAEGPFSHPIALGMYSLMVLPFSLYRYINGKRKLFSLMVFTVTVITIFMTISRGIIISMIFELSVIFLLSTPVARRKIIKFTVALVAVGVILGPILFNPVMDIIYNATMSVLAVYDKSIVVSDFGRNAEPLEYRMGLYKVALSVLAEHPLVGLGPGFFNKNSIYVSNFMYARGINIKSIDNDYLYFLFTKGLLGLISIVLVRLNSVITIYQRIKQQKSFSYNVAFIGSFMGYYISLFTAQELASKKILWILLPLSLIYNSLNDPDELIKLKDSKKEYKNMGYENQVS